VPSISVRIQLSTQDPNKKIHTDDNGLDMMIKTLSMQKLETCRRKAGLVEPPT